MMTMHVHDLAGCASAPLAHYLKALGILRLVSEQADPSARGWWDGERFRLLTNLSGPGLQEFFLCWYEPTPLASPWNKGSGYFYPNDPGLSPVESSTALRFARLRDGVQAGRLLLGELENADQAVRAIKDEAKDKKISKAEKQALKTSEEYKKRLAEAERKFKKLKAELIPRIRLEWRGSHREWMDAAMVLLDDGMPKFPALLGTGGNDGRLDFTNNFFQRLNEIFDLRDQNGSQRVYAKTWLSGALWGCATPHCQHGSAVGQYLPGMAGGANSGNGPDANSLLNPFDFILMLEGAVIFAASATRRLGVPHGSSRVAAPFTVGGQGAGYASSSDGDESARGEQWMPLWGQPMLLTELRHLLAEGRAQVGARAAKEPLDLARAVARLGVARGINAFQRYGYIERNGQSNLAVPLGRFVVPEQAVPQLSCLDDLEAGAWLPRVRLQARDSKTHKAPHRMKSAEHSLAEAMFAVIQHPQEAARWQALLLALFGLEAVMVSGSGIKAGPIPKLRSEWVAAGDDGSPEFRLAVSLALQAAGFRRDKMPIDPVRRHWIAMKNEGTAAVMQGRSGLDDAIALVERRLIEAAQSGQRRLPLVAAFRASSSVADLADLVSGKVDLDCTLALARALMAVDGRQWAMRPQPLQPAIETGWPDDAWLAIRLAMLPWPLSDGREIRVDPAIVRRLASGDAASALELALRRLRAAGIRPAVRIGTASEQAARLWAAALAFPINRQTAESMLRRLDPNRNQL